jgi:hypothetical protein
VGQLAATRNSGHVLVVGVRTNGEIVSAQTADTNLVAWTNAEPTVEQSLTRSRWESVTDVFAGPAGDVYAVTSSGTLERRVYALPVGRLAPPMLVPGEITTVGEGWEDSLESFKCGDRFFRVTPRGELQYRVDVDYPHPGRSGRWVTLDTGWTTFSRVFGAGATGIYTLSSEGALAIRGIVDRGTDVLLLRRAAQVKLANGAVKWTTLPCEVEGYSTSQSAAAGETLDFNVGSRMGLTPVTVPVAYDYDLVRLRRLKHGLERDYDEVQADVPAQRANTPPPKAKLPDDWLVNGAQWPVTFSLNVPAAWRSGLYALRCTDTKGERFYVPFVVRPTRRASSFAVIANTNTWNAYNVWGGQGKYAHNTPLPTTLPFQRPHPGLTPEVLTKGPAELLNQSLHLLRAELWVLGWLDELRETDGPAYAYDMFTDLDLHYGFPGLDPGDPDGRYKAIIINTHSEYWTKQMYDNLKSYQQRGGSIIYLGGNGIYENVRLTGRRDPMTIFPEVDWHTVGQHADNEDVRSVCLMRNIGYPERAILGVGCETGAHPHLAGQSYLLEQDPSTNPVLVHLPMNQGDALGEICFSLSGRAVNGWEVDQRGPHTPDAAQQDGALLALGDCACQSGEMLFYKTESGGVVFSASTLSFSASLARDTNLQSIVKNALDLCP